MEMETTEIRVVFFDTNSKSRFELLYQVYTYIIQTNYLNNIIAMCHRQD